MTEELSRFLVGRGCRLCLDTPNIMGIINVTPDSFSDGGCYAAVDRAVERGLQLEKEGAALLDIGGESTRPGAQQVSLDEELERVIPVVEGLRRSSDIPLSVDTTKAAVAREAIAVGVNYINDVSGLNFDRHMAAVAAESGAGIFLMHTRGRPDVMQRDTSYDCLVDEVIESLAESVAKAREAGVEMERIAVDPGIGFGKDAEGNLELLNHLNSFHRLNCPILLGTSRKSFIGRIVGQDDPLKRLAGTLATVALGVAQGVQFFRVHDVCQARDAALVAWAIREKTLP